MLILIWRMGDILLAKYNDQNFVPLSEKTAPNRVFR